MYTYITRIKEKHLGEFQVNPEHDMLRNACKMHMQMLLYFITAAIVDLLTNNLKSLG
jgi:hypothetical protein